MLYNVRVQKYLSLDDNQHFPFYIISFVIKIKDVHVLYHLSLFNRCRMQRISRRFATEDIQTILFLDRLDRIDVIYNKVIIYQAKRVSSQ